MTSNTKKEINVSNEVKEVYDNNAEDSLHEILQKVASQRLSIEEAELLIRKDALISVEDIVAFDQYRENRRGIPEVVFSESKSISMLTKIIEQVIPKKKLVLFTRLTKEQTQALKNFFSLNNE